MPQDERVALCAKHKTSFFPISTLSSRIQYENQRKS